LDLQQRIEALEVGKQFEVTQSAIREREQEFLLTLRTIQDQMALEERGGSGVGSGNDGTTVKALQTENEVLKAKIAKQEYRIKHLVMGMEKLLNVSTTTTK
jgi:hypothetical protein